MANARANLPADAVVSGRYRLARLLGQGGIARVYAARDSETDRDLALKRLLPNAGIAAAKLFEREYRTLVGLRHPGIVEVYDYGSDAEGPFYTMELVLGSELATLAPMPWREACACLRDAAAILGVLHARKLLHRDLTPRNLLQTASGRLKLIDFGALADFGKPPGELVGTPPFIAPEALRGDPLDQRSDLFALGALGYWLLTGVHAFPAQRITDLASLYPKTPALASQVLALTQQGKGEPVPDELDALLAALLRLDPAARPSHTAELIDRLNAVAELAPEHDEATARGYLESKVFVGRSRERALARQLIVEAKAGHARSLLVEGDAGVGRTRFLHELGVLAQVTGVSALGTDARDGATAFSAASALALAMLRALPELATRKARPYRSELALTSAALARALQVQSVRIEKSPDELRVRAQNALRDWLLDVCREQPIALFVDDYHAIDEESQAWFASLAHADRQHALLLVASIPCDAARTDRAAVHKLREASSVCKLGPLSSEQTFELLRSMFGSVAFLERCAERVHRASGGLVAHSLELSEHLVRSGRARYVDGLWELPSELAPEELPRNRRAGHDARIAALPPEVRKVADRLSIHGAGALTLAQAVAVVGSDETRVLGALQGLIAERLLDQVPDGYRFRCDDVRAALYDALLPDERVGAHLALGQLLASTAGDDHVMQLRAAIHLLRGGATEPALTLLVQISNFYMLGDVSSIRVTAPLFEEIVPLLRESGCDEIALAVPLSVLAAAGYFVDRRYAVTYGETALTMFSGILRLSLFHKLRRVLGQKLALICALIVAALGIALRGRRRILPLKAAISKYITCASSLNGTAAATIDIESGRRYAAMLEPFHWLGEAPRVVHEFSVAIGETSSDLLARSQVRVEALLDKLEHGPPIRDLADRMKRNYIAGGLTAVGVRECWRDRGRTLEVAARLDRYGPLYTLFAEQLRWSHYANRGELARAEEHRQRFEVQAVQLGSSWQVETWGPSNTMQTALRTHDAMLAKRVANQLSRLQLDIPWLKREQRMAQGTYLVLRGKYEQALPLLDTDERPREIVGWSRSRGTLARAYNGLRQHARAKEVCEHAIGLMEPADFEYVVANLSLPIELALAEAGLGHLDVARAQLAALRARHAPNEGRLTLGAIEDACARVELMAGDLSAARTHLLAMEGHYRPLGSAPLTERVERLARALQRAEHPATYTHEPGKWEDGPALLMQLSVFFTQQRHDPLPQRADKALGVVRDLVDAQDGFVLMRDSVRPVAALEQREVPGELSAWATRLLEDCVVEDRTVIDELPTSDVLDASEIEREGLRYRMTPLYRAGAVEPLGCLVLGFQPGTSRSVDPSVLRVIAQQLSE